MITVEQIIEITAYFDPIHHTPGRLRVKVDRSIKSKVENVSFSDIERLPQRIAGLKKVKINKIAATATILYDPVIFEPVIWNDLLSRQNLDEIVELLNFHASQLKEV